MSEITKGGVEKLRCKKRAGEWLCGGRLVKSNWLPESGEDPRLREYMCQSCQTITYLPNGRRLKINNQPKADETQGALL